MRNLEFIFASVHLFKAEVLNKIRHEREHVENAGRQNTTSKLFSDRRTIEIRRVEKYFSVFSENIH
jgi:hypothetical protein